MSTTPTAERLRLAVAEEVRVALARKRLSGVKLAEMIGRSQVYVSRRLRGEVAFDMDDLGLIAAALDVTIGDLLPREQGRTTRQYFPGERVIATVQGSDRRATTPRRPVKRRHRLAPTNVRPLAPAVI